MTNAFYTIAGAILVLGVMVLVHEFGHYAAAKLLGVRVEVFSIGFGRRLFGFKRGDTDYRVSLLPLGGYVKMSGVSAVEMPEEKPANQAADPGEFLNHPRWHRLIIAVAGPLANILLAVALLTVGYAVHHVIPFGLYKPAVVGWVSPGSAAEHAGVKEGDRVVEVGGQENPTWWDLQNRVMISPNQPLPLQVQRDGKVLSLTLTPALEGRQQTGDAGWLPQRPFEVTGVEPNLPGAKAGLQVGDRIVSVDGKPIQATEPLKAYLQSTKGKPVTLNLIRQGKEISLVVVPQLVSVEGHSNYRIGFLSEPTEVETLPLSQAFSRSVEECRKLSGLLFTLIGKMVQQKVSVKQLSGPIEIVKVSGETVQYGGAKGVIKLMAFISLQLGLFNLLPFPILDGGLIAMLLVESAMRRDINEAIKVRLYQAAFVCLVLFAGMVIVNDVLKMLPGQ